MSGPASRPKLKQNHHIQHPILVKTHLFSTSKGRFHLLCLLFFLLFLVSSSGTEDGLVRGRKGQRKARGQMTQNEPAALKGAPLRVQNCLAQIRAAGKAWGEDLLRETKQNKTCVSWSGLKSTSVASLIPSLLGSVEGVRETESQQCCLEALHRADWKDRNGLLS